MAKKRMSGCYRVQVGIDLGLVSKCMSEGEAKKIARFIDQGGMHVYVLPPVRRGR